MGAATASAKLGARTFASLVAEYTTPRVTERDLKGTVIWRAGQDAVRIHTEANTESNVADSTRRPPRASHMAI